MKKNILIAALAAVMIVASSGMTYRQPEIRVGAPAPELIVSDTNHCVDLQALRGSYVLLSFWSSSDAPSRVLVNAYDTAVRNPAVSAHGKSINHVSVNFDESKPLFDAIVRADNLDSGAQYNATGSLARSIIANFNLRDGFGSLLIDPDGIIVAINPEISNLTAI